MHKLPYLDQWQDILLQNQYQFKRNDIGYGKSGTILFLWYKYLVYKKETDLYVCQDLCEDLMQSIQNSLEKPSSFLFIELTEVSLLLDILDLEAFQKLDLQSFKSEVYNLLLSYSRNFLVSDNIDPYTGGGYIYYLFLLRKDKLKIQEFISYLELNKKVTIEGAYIRNQNDRSVQLGLAHGISFIVTYLSLVNKVYPELGSKNLLEQFTLFLINQKQDHGLYQSVFPDKYGQKPISRLNICYGDAGILYALQHSNKALDGLIQKELNEIEPFILNRIQTTIMEGPKPGLLYGQTGLATFLEIYQSLSIDKNSLSILCDQNYRFLTNQIIESKIRKSSINSFTIKNMSFAEGIIGQLIFMMGKKANDYRYAKSFFLLENLI
ncbi:lanthionine synthetase LanC family protein [Galbibacter pacificus]|uniref:Lanthionine synthetase C-like protein n=1 Tax=Galbibacter pacificus TaxID=2996052 RepID=A0ABT6FRY1_9FLAO|nr:lanthionine synthetase LanC family protein [Galbibacter pacificus]MDG3582880.1 hypothetical protein [Galbibacter pacificus]MDG3586001.1 hypothetical protein [Galbibacter pacificus]